MQYGEGGLWKEVECKALPSGCHHRTHGCMTVKMGKANVGLLALTIPAQQWKGPYWDVKCNTLLLPLLPPFR